MPCTVNQATVPAETLVTAKQLLCSSCAVDVLGLAVIYVLAPLIPLVRFLVITVFGRLACLERALNVNELSVLWILFRSIAF